MIVAHSLNMETERSFDRLTEDDLAYLSELAQDVLNRKISRTPVAGQYVDRLIMLALCQGGAQHYVDGKNGVLKCCCIRKANSSALFGVVGFIAVQFGMVKGLARAIEDNRRSCGG